MGLSWRCTSLSPKPCPPLQDYSRATGMRVLNNKTNSSQAPGSAELLSDGDALEPMRVKCLRLTAVAL